MAADPAETRESFVQVSERDARYFQLSGGEPYVPIGLNAVNPRRSGGRELPDTDEGLAVMEGWMERLSENGGNHLRVWLGRGFWNVEHERCGEYDEERAERIDALLELARRYGIRLKMTLEHFREIEPGKEGTTWAFRGLHHVSRGGTAESIADWFDGEASRSLFKDKLAWYADRYGDEPTVYGWELWNEVNTVRGGDYMAWTEEMLGELHRLFPRNLCMQSLGSFDVARKRPVYERLSTMAGNDVVQVHRYLDPRAGLSVCRGPVDLLAADAVCELQKFRPGRPIVLAESGAVKPNHGGPFELYGEDTAGIILHDVLFAPFFAGAAGSGQNWHWGCYVDANDLWWQFGRFAEALDGVNPPAEDFTPTMFYHPRLRVYALIGCRQTLAWCRDTQNNWMTELREGEAPPTVEGATVDLPEKVPMGLEPRFRTYDPWEDRWDAPEVDGRQVRLPPFSRSIILRIEHDQESPEGS